MVKTNTPWYFSLKHSVSHCAGFMTGWLVITCSHFPLYPDSYILYRQLNPSSGHSCLINQQRHTLLFLSLQPCTCTMPPRGRPKRRATEPESPPASYVVVWVRLPLPTTSKRRMARQAVGTRGNPPIGPWLSYFATSQIVASSCLRAWRKLRSYVYIWTTVLEAIRSTR